MRRLLSKPRRVLLRLLGVKRRRKYSNKNKYVAMLLNHDKKINAMAKADIELDDKINKSVITQMERYDDLYTFFFSLIEDKIGSNVNCTVEEHNQINDLTKVDSKPPSISKYMLDCMDDLENDVNKHYREVNRKLYDEALTKRDCRIKDLEDEVTNLKAEIQELLQTN